MKQKPAGHSANGKLGKESATRADVAAVKSELKADVAAVKADVGALRSEVDRAVMKLEFKIDDSIKDAKQEVIEHMDKKFGEYINHVDAVFGEFKIMREEQAFIAQHSQDHSDRLDDHDNRIGALEKKVAGRAG
ncbi:hypothetical protein HY522_07580 [bacterium]|nr:hypothetical protein [bacterium]